MNKKFFIIFAFISLPIILFTLLVNKKNKFLNNLYFDSPFLFVRKKQCKNYDYLLNKSLDDSFSVSIIDEGGNIISEYNSNKLRIPASNLKLISTGYVMDKYNPYDSLNTSLLKDSKANLYLIGSGDPDLSLKDINNLIKIKNINKYTNLYIVEVNDDIQWPEGWTYNDKLYNYGAPITTLAINSNQNNYIDKYYLKNYIYNKLIENNPNSKINITILNYKNSLKRSLRSFKEILQSINISIRALINLQELGEDTTFIVVHTFMLSQITKKFLA